jgi:hypothetical protein
MLKISVLIVFLNFFPKKKGKHFWHRHAKQPVNSSETICVENFEHEKSLPQIEHEQQLLRLGREQLVERLLRRQWRPDDVLHE